MKKIFLMMGVVGLMTACSGNASDSASTQSGASDNAGSQEENVVDESADAADVNEASAEETAAKIKEFYATYMTNIDKGNDSANEKLIKSVLTEGLYEEFYGYDDPYDSPYFDADPVINAQDATPKMIETLTVAPTELKGVYEVSYTDGWSPNISLTVEATCVDGNLQIQSIFPSL